MDKQSNANISHLPLRREARASTPYLALTQDIAITQAKPLRIVLDCQRFNGLSGAGEATIDFMTAEIQLWASTLGARTIRSLYLVHPHPCLEPYELTRILHLLASRFRIASADKRKYAVVSACGEINASHLALIKGLGFNCYQLVIAADELAEPDAVMKKVRLLRDYALHPVGIQLLHTDCVGQMRDCIKQIEVRCQPDYICLSNAWDSFDIEAATDRGPNGDLACEQIDVLELGPEGNSTIGDISIQNYCSREKYKAALEVARLPIHVRRRGQ